MIRIALAMLALITILFTATEANAKTQEFIFEDDYIEGELSSADFIKVTQVGDDELFTLIRVRESFNDKLLAEIEEL